MTEHAAAAHKFTPTRKTKGRKPQFTAKQVERMRYMNKQEGIPIHEIARIMGIGKSSVAAYLKGTRSVRG